MAFEASTVVKDEILNQQGTRNFFDLLPDDLLINILSFAPTKVSVSTSILSKRWRYLWCNAGISLTFEDTKSRRSDITHTFVSFSDRVLSLHKSCSFKKFTFLFNSQRTPHPESFCRCLDHIFRCRKPEELFIYAGKCVFTEGLWGSFLPIYILNSETLKVLKLECHDWRLLSACPNGKRLLGTTIKDCVLSLPNLKVLHMWVSELHYHPSMLSFLFSAAPQLEEAYLGGTMSLFSDGTGFSDCLHAPSLKRLRLSWNFNSDQKIAENDLTIAAPLLEEFLVDDNCLRHYVIDNMSSLLTAKVNVGRFNIQSVEPGQSTWVCELLQGLANVKSLHLSGCTMNALSIAKHHDPAKFTYLSRLQLRVKNYNSWDFLSTLLQNAPNLEVLVLKKEFKNWYTEFHLDSSWPQPKEVPACLSKTLYEIEIWDCEAHQIELDLVSYLLRNGKALNKFMVDLLPHRSEAYFEFREKLLKLPKGSNACEMCISALPACPSWNKLHQGRVRASGCISNPQRLSYEELSLITDGFDLSKVYRGKITNSRNPSLVNSVIVKIWVLAAGIHDEEEFFSPPYEKFNAYCLRCFQEELNLLQHPYFNSQPFFPRLHGYCIEDNNERFGVVYDLNPLDSLHNLIPKDSFNWIQRIRVALGLACLLEYLHNEKNGAPTLIRNLDPAHLMIDQNHNPILVDFSRISNGIFPNRTKDHDEWSDVRSCSQWWLDEYDEAFSEIDTYFRVFDGQLSSAIGSCNDIFGFGVILLSLISQRVHEREETDTTTTTEVLKWAEREYRPTKVESKFHSPKISLVHRSFKFDPTYISSDGYKLTSLAMHCVGDFYDRARMKGVVKCLLKLRIVKQHWNVLNCE